MNEYNLQTVLVIIGKRLYKRMTIYSNVWTNEWVDMQAFGWMNKWIDKRLVNELNRLLIWQEDYQTFWSMKYGDAQTNHYFPLPFTFYPGQWATCTVGVASAIADT